MMFVRIHRGPVDRSVSFVRGSSLGALLSYPTGALILASTDDRIATSLGGYGLIFIALVCSALLIGTSAQRIMAGESTALDGYELHTRYRAMSNAYAIFSLLALCAIIYAAVASDSGSWVPSTYEHYNGLFWGVFLYGSVLPTACLAWRLETSSERAAVTGGGGISR